MRIMIIEFGMGFAMKSYSFSLLLNNKIRLQFVVSIYALA